MAAVDGDRDVVPKVLAWRRPHRRLRRTVRAAASGPPLALEQGLPGAAGLFAVARGQGRLALVHIRPAPDDGRRGELEVRTLATRDADDLDAVGTWLDDGLLSRVIGYAWVLIASYLALRAARRARDPFAL